MSTSSSYTNERKAIFGGISSSKLIYKNKDAERKRYAEKPSLSATETKECGVLSHSSAHKLHLEKSSNVSNHLTRDKPRSQGGKNTHEELQSQQISEGKMMDTLPVSAPDIPHDEKKSCSRPKVVSSNGKKNITFQKSHGLKRNKENLPFDQSFDRKEGPNRETDFRDVITQQNKKSVTESFNLKGCQSKANHFDVPPGFNISQRTLNKIYWAVMLRNKDNNNTDITSQNKGNNTDIISPSKGNNTGISSRNIGNNIYSGNKITAIPSSMCSVKESKNRKTSVEVHTMNPPINNKTHNQRPRHMSSDHEKMSKSHIKGVKSEKYKIHHSHGEKKDIVTNHIRMSQSCKEIYCNQLHKNTGLQGNQYVGTLLHSTKVSGKKMLVSDQEYISSSQTLLHQEPTRRRNNNNDALKSFETSGKGRGGTSRSRTATAFTPEGSWEKLKRKWGSYVSVKGITHNMRYTFKTTATNKHTQSQ